MIRKPTKPDHPIKNKLLLALSRTHCQAVFERAEFVNLPLRTMLTEEGQSISFGYFINDGLASVLSVMRNGKSVETGLIGREGFAGIPLVSGLRTSSTRIFMQVAGSAFRVTAKDFKSLLKICPPLEIGLHRYSQELTMQATQTAACNRLHGVDQRLARWLLMSQDRLGGNVVPLTQEFLAHMLGTRRASVTVAAGILQKAGLIKYTRGAVTIQDRKSLENAACECYAMLVQQTQAWKSEV
jgi:CRP-like cAMP-binding protein